MTYNWWKLRHKWSDDGYKLSRKEKKWLLGKRLNNAKLRRLLRSIEIIETPYPESNMIKPYCFCPKCGCRETYETENMVEYPERYVIGYCLRCDYPVYCSDNSPFYHCLEFENFKLC